MKNLGLIFTIILLWGCATQSNTVKPQVQKDKIIKLTPEEIYNNYPVNISLSQNKNLFNQLDKELITKSEYDSLLTDLGRTGKKYYQIEQLICNTKSDSIFREIVRAEYFIHLDSLFHIVDRKLSNLIKIDSTNTSLFVLLGISNYKQKNYPRSIEYLQKAKSFTDPFDKYFLFIFLANLYEDFGKPLKAINEYEEVFDTNSNLILEKWDNLFELLISTKQYDKAEKLFNEVELLSNQTDFKKTHWTELVKLYWEKNDLSEAENFCLSIRDTTNYEIVTKELVSITIKKGDYKSAENYLWELSSVNINSYQFSAEFNFVEFYSWDDHYSESFDRLKTEVSNLSKNNSANICLGYFLAAKEMNQWTDENRDESKIRQGLAYFKKVDQKQSKLNFVIGYLLQTLNENNEAIPYYNSVSIKDGFYPYAQINLSVIKKPDDINESLGNLLEAQKILKENLEITQEIGDYFYLYLNDYHNAIKWYQSLLIKNPNEHLRSIWVANSYLKIDEIDNAQLTISQTIDKIFTDESSWSKDWYLGMAYKTKGDINTKLEKWEQSKRDYEKSIKYDPKDMDSRLALAGLYYKLEDLNNAEITYLTVIDSVISKENVDLGKYNDVLSALNIHYLIFDVDPYKHAKLFEKAIKYFPESNWCYRMLGIAYKNQGNYYKAIKNLNKAIELDPENRYNYYNLAETYSEKGTYDNAIENYKYAIREVEKENINIDQDNDSEDYQSNLISIGEYHSKIANLYKEKEDFDLAILEYQRAISVTPDTTGIIYKFELAGVYFDNNDFEDAINNWQLVFDVENNFNALFNIGLSYLNLGDPSNLKKSKSTFIELLQNIEDNPDFIDSKTRSENFINSIDEELNRIEWPEIIERLLNSNKGVTSEIAKLYQITNQYREINNKWIDGVKETTPNKEYLEYSKKWITTSYDVSPKIFQSENLCDRFKAKLSSITITNNRLKEVQSLWISSAESRKEGISEHSKGFYVKSKDYSGEYERGRAKIDVADEYYADGLKILKIMMEENIDSFSSFGVESLQNMIDYYSDEGN